MISQARNIKQQQHTKGEIMKKPNLLPATIIERRIFLIRGQKLMVDVHLALILQLFFPLVQVSS